MSISSADLTKRIGTLTRRQALVYQFLKEFLEEHGFNPTLREIGDAFKISSTNGIVTHLDALEAKGVIIRQSRLARAITLVGYDYRRIGQG